MLSKLILLRGGGDLASGIALRLHHIGFKVVISELSRPRAVRRAVSFSEAVYNSVHSVEGITARRVNLHGIDAAHSSGEIPVIVDPEASALMSRPDRWSVVIDARMLKRVPENLPVNVPLLIGLGPGFCAKENCDAVIETRRGHTLGRLYWEGTPFPDTAVPEGDPRRVLRASLAGKIFSRVEIGDHVEKGQPVIDIQTIIGPPGVLHTAISGVVRGIIHDGVTVSVDEKIGDVDPRDDASACFLVSDKALAVAGGVLEAILSSRKILGMEFF